VRRFLAAAGAGEYVSAHVRPACVWKVSQPRAALLNAPGPALASICFSDFAPLYTFGDQKHS